MTKVNLYHLFEALVFVIIIDTSTIKCIKVNKTTLLNEFKEPDDCTGVSEVCFNKICSCGPNYKLINKEHLAYCEPYNCTQDTECNATDPLRYCMDSQCICHPKLHFPDKWSGMVCQGTQCYDSKACGDGNAVCRDGRCRCDQNYEFNVTARACVPNNCRCDKSNHEMCISNKCRCAPGFKVSPTNGNACIAENTLYKQCVKSSDCVGAHQVS